MESKDNTMKTLHAKFYASRMKRKQIKRGGGVKYAPRVWSVFKSPGKIELRKTNSVGELWSPTFQVPTTKATKGSFKLNICKKMSLYFISQWIIIMKLVRYFCSTNYQLNELLLWAQPMFSKKKFVVFLQSFMLKSVTGNMGVQNSAIFSLHRPGNAIACRHLLYCTYPPPPPLHPQMNYVFTILFGFRERQHKFRLVSLI